MASLHCSARPLLHELPLGARVLIIRLRSFGDALLTTPALRALKRWRPDLRLSVLLYREFAPVLQGNPDVDEVIEVERHRLGVVLSSVRALPLLRRRRFAACFNLHGNTLSAVLTWASGAPHRIAPAHFGFGWAYTARSVQAEQIFARTGLHSVEDRLAPFYWAGLPHGEIPSLQITVQAEARRTVAEKLARRGLPPRTPYAVLHPAASFPTKEWPLDRYPELGDLLEARYGLLPVFSCGPGEGWKLDAVGRFWGKPVLRIDPMSFAELVALVEGAALFIGCDSGPMHVAAALGRPLVVLWGSSDARVWSPWRAPHAIVQNYFACNPCPGDRCYAFAQPECILSITLPQVSAAVDRVLTGGTAATSGLAAGRSLASPR